MTEARTGDWMLTASGERFWPLDPRTSEIWLEDIAHSLSNQCRFAGHCREFYSVSQHAVLVSKIVPEEDAKWGLMHDAAEAYLVDLPRPVKHHSTIGTEYRQVEDALLACIAKRFGLDPECPLGIKHADNIVLMTEKRDLMPHSKWEWSVEAEPLSARIFPVTPKEAKKQFMSRAFELGISHRI